MRTTLGATSSRVASTLFLLSLATHQVRSATTQVGCFSSSQPLTNQGVQIFQSSAACSTVCVGLNQAVLGLSEGKTCWCGDQLPPADTKVDSSLCNIPCQGYDKEECGGSDYYTVWLTGTEASVPNYGGGSSSAALSSTPSSATSTTQSSATSTTTAASTQTPQTSPKPSVVVSVQPGHTVVVTQPASQTSSSSTASATPGSSGGPNVAGIVAGVVVGVIVAGALIAGLFFWIRHKRRRGAEDEYKRSQIADFMRGGERKPPQTGHSTTSDSRLDPEAGRRNSSGSIADDQDYSRRILRVANPTPQT